MSSPVPNFSTTQQKLNTLPLGALCKSFAISGLLLFFFYIVLIDIHHYQPSDLLETFKQKWPISSSIISTTTTTTNSNTSPFTKSSTNTPTNIGHIVFGVVGSMNTWKHKKSYSEAWWRPNVTRGYLFLDRAPTNDFLPWPPSSPPFRVNENVTNLKSFLKFSRPAQIRIVRSILELFKAGDEDVRWYVMADDDTVFVVDNLVQVLAKYDHTKYFYIGANSECVKSNFDFSFDMAFGGAGYALSYPLVSAMAAKLDGCLERYPNLWVSDFMMFSCLSDLGIALTHHKGFHQIDLLRDISGLLSAHPQTAFVSLHHIDTVDPIFPKKTRPESIQHLMKAAKADHSRVLQQSICHHRPTNWSISVSWGYSAHIYESIFPRSFLRKPLETFRPWKNSKPPLYMFNTRWPTNNPCEAAHLFFFDSVQEAAGPGQDEPIVTTYVRASSRSLPACSSSGNHSAEHIARILVFSPANLPMEAGGRDCCDVVYTDGGSTTEVRYRPCTKDEMTA